MSNNIVAEGEYAEVSESDSILQSIDIQERYLSLSEGDLLRVLLPYEDIIDANEQSGLYQIAIQFPPELFTVSDRALPLGATAPDKDKSVPILYLESNSNYLVKLQVESYIGGNGQILAPHAFTLQPAGGNTNEYRFSPLVTNSVTIRREADSSLSIDWQAQQRHSDENIPEANYSRGLAVSAYAPEESVFGPELPRAPENQSDLSDAREVADEEPALEDRLRATIDITIGEKDASGKREALTITRREPDGRVSLGFESAPSSFSDRSEEQQSASMSETEGKHYNVRIEPSHAVAVDLILSEYPVTQAWTDKGETRPDVARTIPAPSRTSMSESSVVSSRLVAKTDFAKSATRRPSDSREQSVGFYGDEELVQELWEFWGDVARLTSEFPVATTALVSIASHFVHFQSLNDMDGKPAWELVTSEGNSALKT